MAETRNAVEVHVSGADQREAARLLLKAAEDTGHPVESVATIAGGFLVPYEVAVKAGALSGDDADDEPSSGDDEPSSGDEDAIVVTSDGVEHVGILPASAAVSPDTEAEATDDGQEQPDEGEQEVLRGEALEAALKERGLPTSGTADEKRARVAEYDAARSPQQ